MPDRVLPRQDTAPSRRPIAPGSTLDGVTFEVAVDRMLGIYVDPSEVAPNA